MNPIIFALRHPLTIMVAIVALVLSSVLALSNLFPDRLTVGGWSIPVRTALPDRTGMPVDIFPDLKTPIIYVAQPYGGMDPSQMEAFLTYYYEYHFLYITGIEHVESRNIQGVALMKLYFHPGINMAQAMAETVSYVNRSRSFMPPGTVPPFIMRFDAGSVPVGYLVFSSKTKTIGQIQDQALNNVRPMFAALPGVSAPPPFGGNQRTIVIHADPERLRAYQMSPDEVVTALMNGNQLTPSGSVTIKDKTLMVPTNTVVPNPQELQNIPIRPGKEIYIRNIGWIEDSTDVPTGYGLVDGRRSVYILVTKRADASTLSVVREVRANLPKMRAVLSEDIGVDFVFDQSPYVTRALAGLGLEALLGAILTGLMVVLFLHDWRSVLVVVLNIPFALLGGVVALWLTGQTVNLMTLGGLALAVGILVDEATVEVENIHTQMGKTSSIARAVRLGNAETAVPRLLAMLCILAVFLPSFFMKGAAQALFVPLALAVGFSMLTSYLLSSTFVPVLSTWLLRHYHPKDKSRASWFSFHRFQDTYGWILRGALRVRWLMLASYLGVVILLIVWSAAGHAGIGTEIFPAVDSGQFQLRLRAPDGTPLENTEALAKDVLAEIERVVGSENVEKTVTLVGTASYNYPINSIYLWTAGPQEAVLRVALKRGSRVRIDQLKQDLRQSLPRLARAIPPRMEDVKLSFEAGDIVGQVMSLGSSTPVEIAIRGKNMDDNRAFAEKVAQQVGRIPSLRDLQYVQSLAYPALDVKVDRELAGRSGKTAVEVGNALAAATLSTRFVRQNYWRDPKSGISYQVQVEIPPTKIDSVAAIGALPLGRTSGSSGNGRGDGQLLLRDIAHLGETTVPGEVDRYNMLRMISLTANIQGEDLGRVADQIDRAVKAAGEVPRGVTVEVRGQIVPMRQMFQGLAVGLVMAVVVIFLLLTAYFQSIRLALVVISTAPLVVGGVALALVITRTTLNIQSFMGAIMAIGVAVANAILLVTFAHERRREGLDPVASALEAARQRLRPILMTSCAMIAGMIPMALALGEGGEQTAPLGRAVIGGLAVATLATLLLLPCIFALVQRKDRPPSPSLDPDDPESRHYDHAVPPSPNGDRRAEVSPPIARLAPEAARP